MDSVASDAASDPVKHRLPAAPEQVRAWLVDHGGRTVHENRCRVVPSGEHLFQGSRRKGFAGAQLAVRRWGLDNNVSSQGFFLPPTEVSSMKAAIGTFAALLVLGCHPYVTLANTPAPQREPQPTNSSPVAAKPDQVTAPVVIKTEDLVGEGPAVRAKIVIPRKLLRAGISGGVAPTGAAPTAAPASEQPQGAISPDTDAELAGWPIGSVVAGLALSMAAVSAVFVFRGKRNAKTAALTVLASAVVVGAIGVAQADLLVPGRERPRDRPQIVIELTDDGESVTLILAK
jgi:hypothetical protein